MPKVSIKRQITLPIEQCKLADIAPGDEVETFLFNNQITIVKKQAGAARGVLAGVASDRRVKDQQSLQDTLDRKHS